MSTLRMNCSIIFPGTEVRLTACSSRDPPSSPSCRWVLHCLSSSHLGPLLLAGTADIWWRVGDGDVGHARPDVERLSFRSCLHPKEDSSASWVVHMDWCAWAGLAPWRTVSLGPGPELAVFVITCVAAFCSIPIWSETSKAVSTSRLFVDWCACYNLWANAFQVVRSKSSGGKALQYLMLVFWWEEHLGDGLALSFMLTCPSRYYQSHTIAEVCYRSTVSLKREVCIRMWVQTWPYHT